MSESDKVRSVVSKFFGVPEAEVNEGFEFPGSRMQSSVARSTLHAALRRMAGVDMPTVWTARSYQELIGPASKDIGTAAPVAASVPSNDASSGPAIGIDIEGVENLPWTGDPWKDPFYQENFTESEIAYALRQADSRSTLCGLWCAKESVIKLGSEFSRLRPRQIEVIHDASGRPGIRFIGISGTVAITVSISHSAGLATAVSLVCPEAKSPSRESARPMPLAVSRALKTGPGTPPGLMRWAWPSTFNQT